MLFIFNILYRLLGIYELILLVRCIMSFFPYNEFYKFICKITEPVLSPIRNLLRKSPVGSGMFDFSPVVAILLIGVVERCLVFLSRMF